MQTDYESPPHRSKKNRKRWCKGKVGVSHQPGVWAAKNGLRYWWEKHCLSCGKVLDYWIGWSKAENVPADLLALMADPQPPVDVTG